MEEERKKKKIFPVVALVCVTLLIIALGSYAYWQITRKQEGKNVVGTACLNITFSDSNDIELKNAWPLSDSEGANTQPYSFTIKNECDAKVNYVVGLESLEADPNKDEISDYLDYSYIKVKLDNESPKIYGSLTGITNDSGVRETKELTHHTLEANASVTHYLRLWVDENTPAQNADETLNTSKYFYGRIKVTAGQNIEGDPEPTTETRYNLTFKPEANLAANLNSKINPGFSEISVFYDGENYYVLQLEIGGENDDNLILANMNTGHVFGFSSLSATWLYYESFEDIDNQNSTATNAPVLSNVKIIDKVEDITDENIRRIFDRSDMRLISDMSALQLLFNIEEVSDNNISPLTYPISGTLDSGATYLLTDDGKLTLGGKSSFTDEDNLRSEIAKDVVSNHYNFSNDALEGLSSIFEDLYSGKDSYEGVYEDLSGLSEEEAMEFVGMSKSQFLSVISSFQNIISVTTIEFTDDVSMIHGSDYVFRFYDTEKIIVSSFAEVNFTDSNVSKLIIERR